MLLLVLAAISAGCSIPSTTTPPGEKPVCYENKPELRYWQRDVLAVALRVPAQLSASDDAINSAVAAKLGQILTKKQLGGITRGGSDKAPQPFIRVGQNAVAFYSLDNSNAASLPTACDQRLVGAINAINAQLEPSGDPASQGGTTLHPINVSVGANTSDVVSIVGASPDWTFAGSGIGDAGGGRPGGPPRLLPSGTSPSYAEDGSALQSPNNGEGTTVVVLDTGYSMQGKAGVHASLTACPGGSSAAELCTPKAVPITTNGDVKNALTSGAGFMPFQGLGGTASDGQILLQESDAAVRTDTPDPAGGAALTAPPYEFLDAESPQQPVNVVDHGLFIAGQIHTAAPKARIRLVRVLNDYGIGDLRSILVGLQTAANHPDVLNIDPKSSVVINLSLGFGPPADCLIGVWDRWGDIQKAEDTYIQQNGGAPYPFDCLKDYKQDASSLIAGAHAGLSLPLSFLLADLTNPEVNKQRAGQGLPSIRAVVAASGNESKGHSPPVDADLPAAICGVIPVAAMDATGALAGFSNSQNLGGTSCLSVRHTDSGGLPTAVTVSLQPRSGPALIAQGVNACGIFLQKVQPAILAPSGSPTPAAPTSPAPTNLALWDGTSFAAGFASGYIAREGAAPSSNKVPDRQPCNILGA